ncbi:serine protease MucD [soil metagenome]
MVDNLKNKTFLHLAIFVSLCFGAINVSAQSTAVTNARAVTPEMLSASFADVAKRVESAVVNIDTKGKVPDAVSKEEKPEGNLEDLLDFLRRQQRRPSYSVGSGFIVDKAGYILTNAHVVEDSSRITVRLQSGEEFVARVIGSDEETDLAVLKIDAGRDLPIVKLADSDKARVGDWVLAIGSPFGLAQTVTAGIISQTRRETPYASVFQKFIQTDAAINRGNSGGPLVNMDGEVIGINSQIATSTGDYNGIGFALPSKEAGFVYRQILDNGKVRRGYLGVSLDSIKAEFAKVYGLNEAGGAIILNVTDKQSAAAKAGLLANDIIVSFNGEEIKNAQDLIAKVSSTAPEQTVNLIYLREIGNNVERKTAVIKLDERPSNNKVASADTPKKLPVGGKPELKPLGLTVSELTPQLIETYKLESEKGLLVKEISPTSFIADVKLSNGADALTEGDLIQRVNRVRVTDLKTFNSVVGKLKTGDAVVMHVLTYNRRTGSFAPKIVQFTVQ